LHADSSRFVKPSREFLQQLQLDFGGNESKADMICKFEARLWQPNEKFAMYFKEKSRWPEMSTWRRTSYWMNVLRILEGCLELSLTCCQQGLGAIRCSFRKPIRRASRRVALTAMERGIGLESAPNRTEHQSTFINGCPQCKKQDVNNYVRLFKIFLC